MPIDNKTTKISFPFSPQLKIIFQSLLKDGDEVRIVGGAVRDFLLGENPSDIDLACKYKPEKTIKLLQKNNIQTIKTGIKYGTIDAIIDKKHFQITTLRKDVRNFGRNCDVEFIDDFYEDAKRRDFTINALSVDFEGNLYDYFSGYEDLKKHIVRFIGNPEERIKEDYLRILRFFRVSCYYAKNLDEQALQACKKYQNHLQDLSIERIRDEFFKMLKCPKRQNLLEILQKIAEIGILQLILSSKNGNSDNNHDIFAIKNLFNLEQSLNHQFDPIIILAALLNDQLPQLKLSNWHKNHLINITNPKFEIDFKISKKNILKLLLDFPTQIIIDSFLIALVKSKNYKNLIDDFLAIRKITLTSKIPDFPLNGNDLIALNITKQDIGTALAISKQYWWENNFLVNKQQIIEFLLKTHIKDGKTN